MLKSCNYPFNEKLVKQPKFSLLLFTLLIQPSNRLEKRDMTKRYGAIALRLCLAIAH
jgi:hypothetical protein